MQRVAKAPQRPAAWLVHGSAAHLFIEEFEKNRRTQSTEQLDSILEAYYTEEIGKLREKWPDEPAWMTGGFKKGWKDVEDRLNLALWQGHDYQRLAKEHEDEWRVIATELEFTITLGGVEVYGFIDQLRKYRDGRVIPVDLKSGSKLPGNAQIQLGTYALAVEQLMGIPRPTEGIILHLGRPATARGKEKPSKDHSYDLTHWTPERLGALYAQMDTAERLGLYLPNPTADCERTCGVAQYCMVKGHAPSAEQYERKA